MAEKAGISVKKSEGKEKGPVNSSSKTGFFQTMEINSPVEQVLYLQRTIGNQAVTRLIQSGVLQAKLKIDQPGDVYEHEADRAAEQVMHMSEPVCPECMQEEIVQAKGSTLQNRGIIPSISSALTDLVQRTNGSGGGAAPCTPRPVATLHAFNNTNGSSTSPNNCCELCPITLGVSPNNEPRNAMEMVIEITNHCPGSSYDILRARKHVIYEKVQIGGVWQWRILEYVSQWRPDDLSDEDECLMLQRNHPYIYVIDNPGWSGSIATFSGSTGNGIEIDSNAEQVVLKANFSEYVKFKNDNHNIDWTIISDNENFYWHTTTWLEKQDGQWQLNVDKSEIERGEWTISTTPENEN